MQSEFLLSLMDEKNPNPSVFELYIMDQLSNMLKPALRHVLHAAIATQGLSSFLGDHLESIYFVLQAYLEKVSLFSVDRSAFIVEGMYGLERVQEHDGSYSPINSWQKSVSFAYFLLLPRLLTFLKIRADHHLAATSNHQRGLLYILCKGLQRLLPVYSLSEGLVVALYRLAYALQLTSYHHPLFALLQMTLRKSRHVNSNNHSNNSNNISIAAQSTPPSINNNHQAMTQPIQQNSSSWSPLRSIFLLVFALRGVEWLVANRDLTSARHADHLAHRLQTARQQAEGGGKRALPPYPSPPPPPPIASSSSIIPQRGQEHLCPLCLQSRRHPVCLPSGFVFCYRCILPYLRDEGCCPITRRVCKEEEMIRLYEEEQGGGDGGEEEQR